MKANISPALEGAIQAAVVGAIKDKAASVAAGDNFALTSAVMRRLETNPVAVNELNAEQPWQSRVGMGAVTAVVVSLGVVLTQLTTKNFMQYDWGVLMPAIATLWGAGYALYGRFASGLKPLFARRS